MDLVERGEAARRHPWEVVRARFFVRLLKRAQLLRPGAAWLDAGAGDAWFARRLLREAGDGSSITCWDVNYSADDLEAVAAAGLTATAERPDGTFDRVLLLDVLEHVEDDGVFLTSVVRESTAPDGFVLVSVPAYQSLFSSHDVKLLHHRRYSPAEGRRLLAGAGLRVVSEGCLFHSLLPVRAVQVASERLGVLRPQAKGIGAWSAGAATTRIIVGALSLEASVSLALGQRRVVVPGLSYWALCAKAA